MSAVDSVVLASDRVLSMTPIKGRRIDAADGTGLDRQVVVPFYLWPEVCLVYRALRSAGKPASTARWILWSLLTEPARVTS